ncbi:MAG: hypothetical protein V1809_01695 [Planctomycetota bacterium]
MESRLLESVLKEFLAHLSGRQREESLARIGELLAEEDRYRGLSLTSGLDSEDDRAAVTRGFFGRWAKLDPWAVSGHLALMPEGRLRAEATAAVAAARYRLEHRS